MSMTSGRKGFGSAAHAATILVAAALLCWARPAGATCERSLESRVIPLPVWATLPNEGTTWGAMPVFLRVCPDDRRTESIFAPGVTWNSVIRFTGTFRWYYYPTDDTTFTLIASASTHVNYNLLAWLQKLPTREGAWTNELMLRVQRTVFFRFFGFGPDTAESDETSYTGLRNYVTWRPGLNLTRHLNLGATFAVERDAVESTGVPNLPLTTDVFPDAPGIDGATLLTQGLSLRYDDRVGGDYAERGFRAELAGALVEGLAGSPTYWRAGAQASGIWPELPWLGGAARAVVSAVGSSDAPFYQQSKLGGSFVLRGFTLDRFVDRNAWAVEAEQRIRVFTTRFYGVVADWRVDPFVTAGQVFGPLEEAFSHTRLAAGVGLRAFVRSNVLGRIDVAVSEEGVKVYVEIGYPY